ncbi:MAG: TonB-dependent receptor [Acidobacteria bacterium]|nr:TonB-dependent receptor [Acidobacteriota bacterium]
MRLKTTGWVLCLVAVLFAALPAGAQDFRGRINGTVTDNTGAVLPGVTVTVSGPALIQPQVQVTSAEGDYRFLALPPGVYSLNFELTGFGTVNREGIRVVINQTLSVDMQMQVATLQETVTVTGASPVVDTSTTTMGTNFTKELLTEIPNARDVWAAMAQAPGMQMTSYDVGGSRTGNQTGYRSYGFDDQNQTRLEGIDTTEGTNANAGYFDFGSFEEFQVGGAGADASAFAGGAVLSISVKSGSDRLSGNWYSDYQNEDMIANNVPSNLQVAGVANGRDFFTRVPLQRGNQIKKQYDLNGNVGFPIWRGKAWGFYSYRLNNQFKYTTGLPSNIEQSKLTNPYTFKLTYQVTRNNQLIGFINKRQKLQDKRGISVTTPLSAAYYQSSENTPMKAEWTSVLGSRAFLDVIAGNWWNFFPLRPVRDFDLYDGPWGPGRINLANNQIFDGGANNGYQDQKRWKPQGYVSLSYFKDGWAGSHDFKIGYDIKRDRRQLFRDQPFDIFYRDNGTALSQVDIYNTSVTGTNDVNYQAAWVNDTWKLTNRLTATLGLRFEYYRDEWPEQQFSPNGFPALATFNDARYQAFMAPRTVEARVVANTKDLSPRVGFAYDLTGDNRTVVKAYFGQSRWNSADELADKENPVGIGQLRYAFLDCTPTRTTGCDLNGNRLLDSPAELGAFNTTVGGAGFVRIDRGLNRPVSNELSTNIERELTTGLSARVSYVYKNMRDIWAEDDPIRNGGFTVPITITDPGPDNVLGTGDEQTFQTFDRPAALGQDRVYTNPEGYDADFQNVEVALNRRMMGKWMLLTSAGMTWSKMQHVSNAATPAPTGYTRFYSFRPVDRLFGDEFGRETSMVWNYKVIGRYELPWGIGSSGSWRVQAGQQYGRTITVTMPGDGARTFRVEPITANRYPTVSILDLRLDKSVKLPGQAGKVTFQVDGFNLANSGAVTLFRQTTVNYREVTETLAPRIFRVGFRWDF